MLIFKRDQSLVINLDHVHSFTHSNIGLPKNRRYIIEFYYEEEEEIRFFDFESEQERDVAFENILKCYQDEYKMICI